jgi:RNA polymerase sigma-70 factor (ECF subfamily)
MNPEASDTLPPLSSPFTTTHWSLIIKACGDGGALSERALEELCKAYWPPLYAFVRKSGNNPTDAQDLTQAFFQHFLSEKRFSVADPARGRFRSFLLTSLKRFLVNDWRKATRLKRGSGALHLSFNCDPEEAMYVREPSTNETPETIYDRRWARSVLEHALESVGQDYHRAGQGELFDEIRRLVWGMGSDFGYAVIGPKLGLSEGAFKVAVHRLRLRFRQRVRDAVAATLPDPLNAEEVDAEVEYLQRVLRSGGSNSGVA